MIHVKLSDAAFNMLNCYDPGLMQEWGITASKNGVIEGDEDAMWIVYDTLEDWCDGVRDDGPEYRGARKRTALSAMKAIVEVCPTFPERARARAARIRSL